MTDYKIPISDSESYPLYVSEKQELPAPALSQQYNDPASRCQRHRSRRCVLNFVAVMALLVWTGYYFFNSIQCMSNTIGEVSAILQKIAVHNSHQEHSALDPVMIMNIPEKYLPEIGPDRTQRRLLVIGDIHGMKESLQALLQETKYDSEQDHLVLAGDMVNKGPDSPGVVDLAMQIGASCVRGNHEDKVIRAWEDMQSRSAELGDEAEPDEKIYGHHHRKVIALARALGERRIEWLKRCPLMLRLGNFGEMGEVIVVHAGIEPGVELQDQNPFSVMNMRSIKHGIPSKHHGKAWSKAWNKYQQSLSPCQRQTIIYGHDARRGLKMKEYSLGIDTGCVKGRKLTAAIIEGGETSYSHELAQVKCHKAPKE
ncbi:Ser/Thr protein phosphatase [Blumeria hordei DH14]|uniref:Ser/Thr protein phosphatase n=1 Tax=Blumeria graminis f. sp. hordei (strain DH14) TaxID=546991 RepID=N1JJ08_BLUG1|nr:Ser/Thr protein phosphatase [Blumeria hordei DH14]